LLVQSCAVKMHFGLSICIANIMLSVSVYMFGSAYCSMPLTYSQLISVHLLIN